MIFEVNWSGAGDHKFSRKFLEKLQRVFSSAVPEGKGMRVTVSFVPSARMKTLNRIYRMHDHPTDVLSFSSLEGEMIPANDNSFAGDVVICLPYVRTSAKEQGVDLREEIVRMFVHGAMHCLGYDHIRERDAKEMMPVQEAIIAKVIAGV